MSQRVSWLKPLGPNIIAFRLQVGDDGPTGPFQELLTVLNVPTSPQWVAAENVFAYDDIDAPLRLYRLLSVDTYGNAYQDPELEPFGPNLPPVTPPGQNIVQLDQDTGGTDSLRYVKPNGEPISGADVRVYTKQNYDKKLYSQVLGLTVTNADGRWTTPLLLPTGNTYVVRFYMAPVEEVPGWGPDIAEVVL